MFHIEFGVSGLIFLIALILSIPLLIGVVIRQREHLLNLRSNPPPFSPVQSDDTNNFPARLAYQNFIRQLSHQTTNSLQAIIGAITNLEENLRVVSHSGYRNEDQLADKQAEYLTQIRSEADRLLVQNKNLRHLAELESENAPIAVQSVPLRAIVADIMMGQTDLAAQLGIQLVYQGPEQLPQMLINREQITQALLNLIDNSLKYSRPESTSVILSIRLLKETVRLAVSDDGAGIPESHLPFLFDAAYRAPDARSHTRGGNGLGLAIVKRIIEQHGGDLRAESIYGQGTTVTITLPLDNSSTV